MTPRDEHRVQQIVRETFTRTKKKLASSEEEALAILGEAAAAAVTRIKQEMPDLCAPDVEHVIAGVLDEMLAEAYRQEGRLQ
jgi:hypothetical protein